MSAEVLSSLQLFFQNVYPKTVLLPENRALEASNMFIDAMLRSISEQTILVEASWVKELVMPPVRKLLYRVSLDRTDMLTIVLDVNNLDRVLWLDSLDDNDFVIFWRIQQLHAWIKRDIRILLNFLLQTKLNYLGRPRLVESYDQIDGRSEDQWIRYSDDIRDFLEEQENRAKAHIKPLTVNLLDNTDFSIEFHVWTYLYGRVVNIKLTGNKGHFSHSSIKIAERVGSNYIKLP